MTKQLEYDATLGVYRAREESSLQETSDPTNASDTGFIYTKDVSGSTELFYIDDSGNVTQLTDSGKLYGPIDIPSGTSNLFSGAEIDFNSGSTVHFNAAGANVCFHNGFDVDGGLARVFNGAELQINSDGIFDCNALGSNVTFANGLTIENADLDLESTARIDAKSGSIIQIDSGAFLDCNGNIEDISFANGFIFENRINDPSAPESNIGLLYSRTKNTIMELFFMDSEGQISQLTANGALVKWNVTDTKTTNYTADFDDFVKTDSTSGGFTITLPEQTNDSSTGTEICVWNIAGTNTVTVAASGSDTINGPTTLNAVDDSIKYVSDGNGNWYGR